MTFTLDCVTRKKRGNDIENRRHADHKIKDEEYLSLELFSWREGKQEVIRKLI